MNSARARRSLVSLPAHRPSLRPALRLLPLVLAAALAAGSAGCTLNPGPSSAAEPSASASPSPSPIPSPTPRDVRFTLLAAGDVLPHGPVNESARTGDGFEYSPLLAGIDPWVAAADLALCHLEVPVAPPGVTPSGYPVFRAPHEVVRDLGEQGWDGCSTASNHAADAGFDGLKAALDALDAAGMGHVGTARDREESLAPQLYELTREGRTVTVAHLAATYGLNGFEPPEGEWSVDLIDTDRIVRQAKEARAAGADLVVVSLHDGYEYVTEPTPHQREATEALARSRQVDLVIGHHAHVPQPITRLEGGPGRKGMWVAYGLGNLLSNQGPDCCVLATTAGLMMVADVVQRPGKPARVTDVRWAATTVDLAAGHRLRGTREAIAHPEQGTLSAGDLEQRLAIAQDAVGDAADELREPPLPSGGPAPRVVPRP
ncbi:MAG TPA: CapA family protein [Promicromonospora sp.]|nr:CapA family protein [Promicromonospora sp.]